MFCSLMSSFSSLFLLLQPQLWYIHLSIAASISDDMIFLLVLCFSLLWYLYLKPWLFTGSDVVLTSVTLVSLLWCFYSWCFFGFASMLSFPMLYFLLIIFHFFKNLLGYLFHCQHGDVAAIFDACVPPLLLLMILPLITEMLVPHWNLVTWKNNLFCYVWTLVRWGCGSHILMLVL